MHTSPVVINPGVQYSNLYKCHIELWYHSFPETLQTAIHPTAFHKRSLELYTTC